MKYILAFLFIFCSQQLYGQWVQTSGPSAGPSSMAFNSRGDIFDLKGYFIRSTDDGKSWQDITPYFLSSSTNVVGWGITHDNIYFFADSEFYRSTDNGNSWQQTFKTTITK